MQTIRSFGAFHCLYINNCYDEGSVEKVTGFETAPSVQILSQRIDIRFARQNEGQHVFRRIDFDAH